MRDWTHLNHLTGEDRNAIFESVRTSADRVIVGKGATNYAVGLAVSSILQAILWDEGRVLAVSSLLSSHRGLNDVCLSMSAIVNRRGVDCVLTIPLSQVEEAGLLASAAAIRRVARTLGF